MITKATKDLPEIDWDDLHTELIESDIDERMEVYRAEGTGTDGKRYYGNATFFHEILDEITDIEEA